MHLLNSYFGHKSTHDNFFINTDFIQVIIDRFTSSPNRIRNHDITYMYTGSTSYCVELRATWENFPTFCQGSFFQSRSKKKYDFGNVHEQIMTEALPTVKFCSWVFWVSEMTTSNQNDNKDDCNNWFGLPVSNCGTVCQWMKLLSNNEKKEYKLNEVANYIPYPCHDIHRTFLAHVHCLEDSLSPTG